MKAADESLVVECELDEPREKVWRALTVPEIVAEWLNPERESSAAPADNQPAGDRNDSKAAPALLEYEIVTADRPRLLEYRVREGHGLSLESTVTFELSDTPLGGTRLRIEHDFEQTEDGAALPGVLYATTNALRPLQKHRQRKRTVNQRTRRTRMFCGAYTRFKAAA